MKCPKCGGIVGSHSDLCLDCGHDPEAFSFGLMVMTGMGIIVGVALALFIPLLVK